MNVNDTVQVSRVEKPDDILCAAMDVGEHILRNGGEVRRVEDTIERICRAFGAEHVEVFTITSLIIATLKMPNGERCQQMRRVFKTKNNMYMLEEMNAISRRLCAGELALCDLNAAIDRAKGRRPYPTWLMMLGAMALTSSFAVFFGGTLRDGLCAALATVPVFFVDRNAPRFVNQMLWTAVSSFIAGLLSMALWRLGLGQNPDKIIIGAIMLLIPGLALSNSIRDMLIGDTLSGMMRLLHAVLLTLMIASGFALAIFVMGGVAV